jgi:tetratricopeptide (TPR) repeat protein
MVEPQRMMNATQSTFGREAELERCTALCHKLERGGTDFLWITGESGCGRSLFLRACADRAAQMGWEVLLGECTEDTRADPYGPFLSTLGLCFDKGGRLINDRSVYSIVDQISLDDVFDAVADIPGMSIVAFGIKVGKTIFDSRRRPQSSDELLNRNFEFVLQLLKQIEARRGKPVLLALDDLHLASATTYALIEYLLTRIEDTRLLVMATWEAESADTGGASIQRVLPRLSSSTRRLHLPALPEAAMRRLLDSMGAHRAEGGLADALIEFSRGLPGVLIESLRLVEQKDALDLGPGEASIDRLVERQLSRLDPEQRALLQCAARIGRRIPLDVLAAPPMCAYLGLSERELLSTLVQLADRGQVLAWDGEDAVRFTSAFVRRFLRDQVRAPLSRRDHLRIAEAYRAIDGEAHPARLARHYLAAQEAGLAFTYALRSAEELSRSAAYPEAVQSYAGAMAALEQMPDQGARGETRYELLRAMGLAAEQAGDWAEALARLQEALALSGEDLARQAETHAGIGWLHFLRGEVQSALEHLARSAELYAALDDVPGQAQIDYYLGALYAQQKEWQRAAARFERYLEIGLSEGRASAYVELGNVRRMQRHWAEAEALLKQGIEQAGAEGDYVVLAQGTHYLGSCYAGQGKDEAIDVLNQALEIVRTHTKQPAQVARIQNTLAETWVRMGRWAEAEEAFHASAQIKERLGDTPGLAMTYGGLGRLYLRQWRFDLAVEYLQRDIDLLAREFGANVAWIQQHTNLIGEARRLQGCQDEAARRFAEAETLARDIPDPSVRELSLGYTYMLQARLALDRDDLDAAEVACAAALERLEGTWAEGEIQRTAARLARLRGDTARAAQCLDKALAAVEQGEDIERAMTYLEQAYLCRDRADGEQMRAAVERVVALARRLCNAELERQAVQLEREHGQV